MYTAVRWSELLFGRGDDDYPFWLLTVRVNILLFAVCAGIVLAWSLSPARWRKTSVRGSEILTVIGLTMVAALLRFALANANLMDFGGIPYSRLLFGYKGYFATAQFFSLLYERTTRDIEHAIFFQRIAGTLTVPLVYALCRRVAPAEKLFAASAAFLFAVYPLHVLFSASDALAVFSVFLAAASYVLVAGGSRADHPGIAMVQYLGGFAGLALLTQVRYENIFLLAPPALFLLAHRRRLSLRQLWPALLVAVVLLAIYAYQASSAALSYRFGADVRANVEIAIWHLLLNPFLALPVLFAGSLVVWVYRGWRLGLLALLPWPCAVGLAVVSTDNGHGAARIFANWLILILPFAAYGLSLLWRSPSLFTRMLAGAALVWLGVQPLLFAERIAAQYLEIVEHDRFNALLSTLPPAVKWLVVPDDELLRRQAMTSLEVYQKYTTILAVRPPPHLAGLVGITDYLEQRRPIDCRGGSCAFFFGLPCMEQNLNLNPFTTAQCRELVLTRRLSVLDDTRVIAAPFVDCSIYTGALGAQLCDAATKAHHFIVYRIEE